MSTLFLVDLYGAGRPADLAFLDNACKVGCHYGNNNYSGRAHPGRSLRSRLCRHLTCFVHDRHPQQCGRAYRCCG